MSKKEISLIGRKRTRELDNSVSDSEEKEKLEEKKEALIALMAMKTEVNPSEPKKPEESKKSVPPVPLGVAAVYEREVKAAVAGLIKVYYRLNEAGTLNRRAYSVDDQGRKLVQEIKKYLAERADFYASKGMDHEDNRQACQQYVNDVREGLKMAGIRINYLEVRPAEKA